MFALPISIGVGTEGEALEPRASSNFPAVK